MARPLDPRFGITPHASRGLTTRWIVLGGFVTLSGVAVALTSSVGVAILPVAFGGLLLWNGILARLSGFPVQVINKALDAAARGRLADATELLDHVAATTRLGYLLRSVDLQRALVALRLGEVDAALTHADAAVARPISRFMRQQERLHVASAVSLRALLRAAAGDVVGARADIARTREAPEVLADSLAWAEVAEAILLEKEGDRDGLRAHLTRRRRVLFEHTHPRERAIVRAFQRMLGTKAASVYRRAAPRDPGHDEEPALTDWVARIAPAAAPFVRAPARTTSAPLPAPASPAPEPAAQAAAEARLTRGGRPLVRVMVVWVLLIMVFLAIWEFLNPGPGAARAPVPPPEAVELSPFWSLAPSMLLLGLFAGILTYQTARLRAQQARLVKALCTLAREDDVDAEKDLEALARAQTVMVSAQAHLALASLADRRADLAAALAHCDQGLARLNTSAILALASDALLPGLLSERAALLAATGRGVEARAEMDMCAQRSPSFGALASAQRRVALLDAAHRGDVAGAAAVAAGLTNESLGLREELLADLARAAAGPADLGSSEIERLRVELRTDAISRTWIEVVAPAVLEAFGRAAGGRDAEAEGSAKEEPEGEATREAEAEEEAGPTGHRAAQLRRGG